MKISFLKNKNNNKGVTLVILAIMILVIGLLIFIILQGLKAYLGYSKNKETYDRLGIIKKAITRFVLENGRFPCPASLEDIPEDSTFGVEQVLSTYEGCETSNVGVFVSTSGQSYYGAVPTKSIKLSDEFMVDKWNNKISYVVNKSFVLENAFNEVLENKADGTIAVTRRTGEVSDAVYILISYGKSGGGAYNKDSSFRGSGTPCDESNVLDENDEFDESFEGMTDCNFIVFENKINFIKESQEEEEIQNCPEEVSVSVPISGSVTSWSTTFPSAKFDEISYSVDDCPTLVSSPASAGDYYYESTDEFNRVGRECGADGDWESGFDPLCTEKEKCVRPSTLNSRAVTWDDGLTFDIVHSGSITGTFDDNGQPFTVECIDEQLYLTLGLAGYVCLGSHLTDASIPEVVALYATWDDSVNYDGGTTATATGCATGYTQNPSGPATIDCSESTGWDPASVTNPCMKNCSNTVGSGPTVPSTCIPDLQCNTSCACSHSYGLCTYTNTTNVHTVLFDRTCLPVNKVHGSRFFRGATTDTIYSGIGCDPDRYDIFLHSEIQCNNGIWQIIGNSVYIGLQQPSRTDLIEAQWGLTWVFTGSLTGCSQYVWWAF